MNSPGIPSSFSIQEVQTSPVSPNTSSPSSSPSTQSARRTVAAKVVVPPASTTMLDESGNTIIRRPRWSSFQVPYQLSQMSSSSTVGGTSSTLNKVRYAHGSSNSMDALFSARRPRGTSVRPHNATFPKSTSSSSLRYKGRHHHRPFNPSSLSSSQSSSSTTTAAVAIPRNSSSFNSIGSCHSHSSSSSTTTVNNRLNSTFAVQVAQRSSGSTVKAVIDQLREVCDQQQVETEDEGTTTTTTFSSTTSTNPTMINPPVQQCVMLSQWSSINDAYYQTVIQKYGGVAAVSRTMNLFRDCPDIQLYGCLCFAYLSKTHLVEEGVHQVILQTMQDHPDDASVQSAALQALRGLVPILIMKTNKKTNSDYDESTTMELDDSRNVVEEIRCLSNKASSLVCLTKEGKAAAADILNVLDAMVVSAETN